MTPPPRGPRHGCAVPIPVGLPPWTRMPAIMKSAHTQASYQGRVQNLAEDHLDGKTAPPTAPILEHPAVMLLGRIEPFHGGEAACACLRRRDDLMGVPIRGPLFFGVWHQTRHRVRPPCRLEINATQLPPQPRQPPSGPSALPAPPHRPHNDRQGLPARCRSAVRSRRATAARGPTRRR